MEHRGFLAKMGIFENGRGQEKKNNELIISLRGNLQFSYRK